jgi:hypothetical protein
MNYATDFKSIKDAVYGVLEWPAMARLRDAAQTRSGLPSYKH